MKLHPIIPLADSNGNVDSQGKSIGGAVMNSEKHRQAYHKSRLGRILVKKGYLTGQQLDSALERMENPSQRLGEYLVDQQLITRWQLRRALSSQSQLRLAASLSMALLSPVQLMAAGEESA
ncbi:MAG: hypothetical protein ACPG5T_08120, partial [Endozoicomonas sp.]